MKPPPASPSSRTVPRSARVALVALVAATGGAGGLPACSSPGGGGGIVPQDGVVTGDGGDASAAGDGIFDPGDGGDATSTTTTAPPDGAGETNTGTVCSAGDLACDNLTVISCRPDGSGFEPIGQCGADQVCADGHCLACYPSQRRCTPGNAVESCTDDGRWELTQDCGSAGMTCVAGSCQSPCARDPKANDNSGCDYWAVDMDNHVLAQSSPYALIVSNLSQQSARVKITRKDGAGVTPTAVVEREVGAGQLSIFDLPNRNMGAAGLFWNAYRVESTVPIVAYQFNPLDNVDVFSNDASILIPSNTFGTEYFIVSRSELLGRGANANELIPYRGEFAVIAASSQTNVTIVPTCRTQAGANMPTMAAGQSYTYALEPYQVLNVKSDQEGGDLTGSLVTSDKPVAVFAGHEAALSATVCCADHLEHQMFPVSTWGTSYVATKARQRQVEPDYWRIIASEDGTTVTFDPPISAARELHRGKWLELVTAADFVITANKPISVAQILSSSFDVVSPPSWADCTETNTCAAGYSCTYDIFTGQAQCRPPDCTPGNSSTCPPGHVCTSFPTGDTYCTAVGDPTLIMVPPVKQFRKDYVFLSPNKYTQDYINIVAPQGASVTLDGIVVPAGNFVSIPNSDWKVARVSVADGTHRVVADQPISVIAYGYDRDVSYGYAAGLNLVEE